MCHVGGADQLEQLTIIAVKRTGLARRAGKWSVEYRRTWEVEKIGKPQNKIIVFLLVHVGIRVGDIITQINDTPAQELTLLEAQLEIHESGRNVKLYVKGWSKTLKMTDIDWRNLWFFINFLISHKFQWRR